MYFLHDIPQMESWLADYYYSGPLYNEGQETGKIFSLLQRYIEGIFHMFYSYWGEVYRLLYRGHYYIGVVISKFHCKTAYAAGAYFRGEGGAYLI